MCDIVKYESTSGVIPKRIMPMSCITVVHKLKIIAVNSGFFLYQMCTWKWLKIKFLMLQCINFNCTKWFIWG